MIMLGFKGLGWAKSGTVRAESRTYLNAFPKPHRNLQKAKPSWFNGLKYNLSPKSYSDPGVAPSKLGLKIKLHSSLMDGKAVHEHKAMTSQEQRLCMNTRPCLLRSKCIGTV